MTSKLANIADYVNEKINVSELDNKTYISTENMLPNKAGITDATTLPNMNLTSAFKKGDVLVSNIRPYFKKIWQATFDGGCSNDVLVFRAKDNTDAKFLYYVLSNDKFFDYSMSTSKGTKMPRGDKKSLMEYSVSDIDFETQQKIARVLSAIDDKIELNNSINKNLEQQIQSVFLELFPFIFNNANDTLEKIISFSNGKKRPENMGTIPVYGGNGILAYTDSSNSENCVIIGRVGAYCGNTFLCAGPCWVSDNAIQAKSKIGDSQLFIFYILKNAHLQSRHIGTGQPLMTQGILNSIPFNMPDISIIKQFTDNCEPMQKLIIDNTIENERLTQLRDTLLPKLMNGEIDVDKVEV